MNDQLLITKLSTLPDDLKSEVSDFIDFLLSKTKKSTEPKQERKPGSAKGMFTIMPDFDEPLEEFKDYME